MDKTNNIDDSHVIQDSPNCTAECQARVLTLLGSSDGALRAMCLTLSDRRRGGRDDFHIPHYCGTHLCKINSKGDADQQCASNTWNMNACYQFNSCVSNY